MGWTKHKNSVIVTVRCQYTLHVCIVKKNKCLLLYNNTPSNAKFVNVASNGVKQVINFFYIFY